jgi:hypothetical protein
VEILLDVVAGESTCQIEPVDLLRRPGLEDQLYERLTVGVPEDAVDDLMTCSAGRTRAEGLRLLRPDGPPDQAGLALLPVGMWDSGSGVPTTLLRTLLLRRLTRRSWYEEWNWSAVHDRLREASERRGDIGGGLYHLMAGVGVDKVVAILTKRLGEDPLPDWLALLDTVATAPHRTVGPADTTGDSLPFVRSLVIDLSAAADPLCGSNRSALYWRIAGGYRDLSRHTDDGSEELFELIQRYEQLARQWRRGVAAHRATKEST